MWPKDDQALVDTFINSGGREDWEPIRLYIPLLGFHQVQNAATAYAALQVIKSNGRKDSARKKSSRGLRV